MVASRERTSQISKHNIGSKIRFETFSRLIFCSYVRFFNETTDLALCKATFTRTSNNNEKLKGNSERVRIIWMAVESVCMKERGVRCMRVKQCFFLHLVASLAAACAINKTWFWSILLTLPGSFNLPFWCFFFLRVHVEGHRMASGTSLLYRSSIWLCVYVLISINLLF